MSECVVRMKRVPKNCDDGCWGSLSGECPWCDHIDGYVMAGNRPPNCPIIAVLPENHGRLVDADALKDYLIAEAASYDLTQGQMGILSEAIDMIDEQPTIVPAERRET